MVKPAAQIIGKRMLKCDVYAKASIECFLSVRLELSCVCPNVGIFGKMSENISL